MTKSIKLKTVIMLLLSFTLVASLFFGIGSITKKAKALDGRTTDIAVFNEAVYERDMTRPFWNSNIIYNETVLVTYNADGTISGKLLYPAVHVISVTNHDRTTFYEEGVNYTVTGNTINAISLPYIHYTLTQGLGGNITEATWAGYTGNNFQHVASYGDPLMMTTGYCTQEGSIYTEGYLYRTNYVQVTYVYNPSAVDTSFLTKHDANYLGGLRAKLEAGQDITMVSIGDSITAGCSSTGEMLNVAPYQPGYVTLVKNEIERVYGVNVNLVRLAVGGTESHYLLEGQAGRTSFVNALANYNFDFAIIAYGMNDQGIVRDKETYQNNIQTTVNELITDSPDCNIVFVNTFPRNPSADANVTNSATRLQCYHDYKSALDTISVNLNNAKGSNVSRVVNMYEVGSAYLNAGKPYAAISSSNYNHPNDSFIRTYAMNVMSVITNYDTMTTYEMNISGDATNLFKFQRDGNGWNKMPMDLANISIIDEPWYQKRSSSEGWPTVMTRRFGVYNPSYSSAEKKTTFQLIYDGYNVNYNAFDVTEPIVIKYNVSAPYSSNGMFDNPLTYGLSLHSTLEDAFKTGTRGTSDISTILRTGVISLVGTNGSTNATTGNAVNIGNTGVAASELYGKLRVNGNANMTSSYFFPANYSASTYQNSYNTVTIRVGETSTTVSVNGETFATLTDVTRSSFPNGVAYLKLATKNNATFNFVDPTVKETLTSSADGSAFTYPVDANGWSKYKQNTSVHYTNKAGETVITPQYGIEGEWNHNGDSGMTLLGNGYNANYTALDVTKPIQLQYLVHPYRSGDYTFALFDDLYTALKAGNSTWQGASSGAKIWMRGANTDLTQGIYEGSSIVEKQLNNRVLFNATLHYDKAVLPNSYNVDTYASKYVDVIFDIGETVTRITVDGNYVGTINVKRSDFTSGYAYMTVANAWTPNSTYIAIIAKKINQDVKTLEEGKLYSTKDLSEFTFAKDANGWADYIQNTNVSWHDWEYNTVITSHYGKEAEWVYGDYSGLTLKNNGYIANYNPLDVTKPIQLEYYLHAIRRGDYTIALFDDLTTALKAGNQTYLGSSTGAKLWMRGSNTDLTQESYQLNGHLLFNASLYYGGNILPDPYNADTCVSKSAVVVIDIGENSTRITVDGNYVGTINVTRSDFASGYAYVTIANAWTPDSTFLAPLIKAPKQDGVTVDYNSKITTTSVTLNSGVVMNMNANIFDEYTEPQMSFVLNGETTVVSDYTANGIKYTFQYNGVTPQYMNREITITLTGMKNGVREVIDTKTTTIKEYAMGVINSTATTELEKSAAVDLLNYGTAAQQRVSCDLDKLANKDLTETQLEKGSTFNENAITNVTSGKNDSGIKWTGAWLILSDKVTIRYAIKLDGTVDASKVTVQFNRGGVITTGTLIQNGSEYYVEYAGISPTEYGLKIVATAYIDGVATNAVCNYSVNSWIKNKYDHATDGALAKSLYVYGESALTFATKNDPNSIGDLEVMIPREMNTTSTKNVIVAENHTISFSDDLWETPVSLRASEFDETGSNAKGYFLDNPILNNNKFFVYVGIPTTDAKGNAVSENNKVPGIVLVHGATGTAFYEWVDFWVARGYAAIAMCTDANVPTKGVSKMSNADNTKITSYTTGGQTFNIGPDNGGFMNDYNLPIEQQWAYNAIAKVIISNSFLRSFAEVDTTRVGITGISYGSFLTSQAAGYDDRYAFAMPIYGAYCQDLGDGIFAATAFGDKTSEKNELYNNYKLMENNETPFLFVNSNIDTYFSILGASMSNKLMKDSKMLLINGFQHGHELGAFHIPEILTFADSICLGTTRLPEILSQPAVGTNVMVVSVPTGVTIASATMYYTDAHMLNEEVVWNTANCTVSGNRITIPTINGAYYYYVNVTDSNGKVVSSQVVHDCNYDVSKIDDYVRPYWASNTMFKETGAFIGETGSFNLLYTPTKLTMVGQYNDVNIEYVEGVDFTLSGNVITRLAGSRMPYWVESEYFLDEPANATMDSTMTNNPIELLIEDVGVNPYGAKYVGKYIPYTPDGATNKPQSNFITVSYEHNGTLDGLTFTDSVAKMKNLHNKFDDVTEDTIHILVVGESVGEGCSSSGTRYAGYVGDDLPDAYDMVGQWIAKHENKKVVVTNIALGGSVIKNWTKEGVGDNKDRFDVMINALRRLGDFATYGVDKGEGVANNFYDLILVRMGGNDAFTPEAEYKAYFTEMLGYLFTYNPNACLITISPFVHNELCPGWGYGSNVQFIERWQKEVMATYMRSAQMGSADVWTACKYSLEQRGKYGKDVLTNNINHANDYVNRWMTQLTLYAIYGDEYINYFNN